MAFEPFNRLKACRYGQMLYNTHDVYIGQSLEQYGEYSEGEVALFRQIVQPGNIVVEAGANIGAHTLFLAQQVGLGGAVLAFEPQRVLFQNLCANMALNSVPNAYCYHQALGAAPGTVKIPPLDYTKRNNFGGLALGGFTRGEDVPVATLDSYNLIRCNFLKIDVEGMEQQVLRGAVSTIARHRPVLYVENDNPDKSDDLIRYIDALGYLMYWHRPYYYNPENFSGNRENIFPNVVSLNMLCVPKATPQKLEGFEPVQVPAITSA